MAPAVSSLELDAQINIMTFELTGKKLVWYSGVPRPFPLALFEVKGRHLPDYYGPIKGLFHSIPGPDQTNVTIAASMRMWPDMLPIATCM